MRKLYFYKHQKVNTGFFKKYFNAFLRSSFICFVEIKTIQYLFVPDNLSYRLCLILSCACPDLRYVCCNLTRFHNIRLCCYIVSFIFNVFFWTVTVSFLCLSFRVSVACHISHPEPINDGSDLLVHFLKIITTSNQNEQNE